MRSAPRRRVSWMLVREGDQEPEYFRGEVWGPADAWTRDPDYAYQFYSRRVAVDVRKSAGLVDDPLVRVVPTFSGVEG